MSEEQQQIICNEKWIISQWLLHNDAIVLTLALPQQVYDFATNVFDCIMPGPDAQSEKKYYKMGGAWYKLIVKPEDKDQEQPKGDTPVIPMNPSSSL